MRVDTDKGQPRCTSELCAELGQRGIISVTRDAATTKRDTRSWIARSRKAKFVPRNEAFSFDYNTKEKTMTAYKYN